MHIELKSTLLLLITLGLLTTSAAAQEESAEHSDLTRMKSMAGDWAAVQEDGSTSDSPMVQYRVTAAGSAVVETIFPAEEHEMVTIYTADGDDLILTHYCAMGNQPRMRTKDSGNADQLFFEFDGGTGMESESDMHMHSLKLTFLGPDRITQEWSTHAGGKAGGSQVFKLQRMGKEAPETSALLDDSGHAIFGAGVHQGDTIAVATALADPAELVGKTVRIEGPVVSVCQKKGCWMRLGDAEEELFVRFQDYGFFVPLETKPGAIAIIEGVLTIDEQSVEEQQHYLEDAGKHDEAAKITEPAKVVGFMATGVAISR